MGLCEGGGVLVCACACVRVSMCANMYVRVVPIPV